ncbi:hypothetical protein ACFQ67_03465 [Streptomyces sp. NPDC056488]|uniref:hypothetical protein n=1 Tax=unclassified Streptomyces TaxID=2593676 RepID=UPI003680E517
MITLPVILSVLALVLLTAFATAAAAGKLARLDGASYPAALLRSAAVFAAVLTLACALTGALAAVVP